MIYQLAKTTPSLGGQVRLDLICNMMDRDDWEGKEKDPDPFYRNYTRATDLHVVPVDDKIRFNEDNGRVCLDFSHLQNIKYLYNRISDSFYSVNPKYNGPYWLYNEGIMLDTFDHTYEMGLKRMRYNRYNKQFSFFTPLWISEKIDFNKMYFMLHIEDADNPTIINISKKITLSDELISYLNTYYATSDLDKPVDDDLLNIKFDPDEASITGVLVNAGRCITKDISYILPNLLERERPVLEFDSIILQQFERSKIIAQQLLNLNLVFDLTDIAPIRSIQPLYGHDMNIYVDVYYNGQKIPVKDLYTNYELIPAYNSMDNMFDMNHNVFEYLHDNHYIGYSYENKLVQSTFHWSMVENPTFTYNFYDGFAPIMNTEDGVVRINGQYFNQANLSDMKYNPYDNNLNWCKNYIFKQLDTPDSIIAEFNTNTSIGNKYSIVKLDNTTIYINNNKYDLSSMNYEHPVTLYLCTCYVPDINDVPILTDKWNTIQLTKDVIANVFDSDDLYILRVFSNNPDNLTLKQLSNIIKSNTGKQIKSEGNIQTIFNTIVCMCDHWIAPYKITFTKSLDFSKAPSPQRLNSEITYFKKDTSHNSYVYRYTGKLCPQFIDINKSQFNYIYHYKQWFNVNDPDVQVYNNLLKSGFKPLYPSISCGSQNYYSLDKEILKEKKAKFYDYWIGDVSWLKDNRVWVLPSQINLQIECGTKDEESVIEGAMWNELYDYLKKLDGNMSNILNDEIYSKQMKHYLHQVYKKSYDFEYKSETDISKVIYKIKFELI